jgi:uncharacterized cupin superfamily protein
MSVESVIKTEVEKLPLNSCPIYPTWILEGIPVARNTVLSYSADGNASTLIWDCTAGRFNWFYDVDETIYVLEGGMVIRDVGGGGSARRLSAGDSIFFPKGARAEWTVETYIRKIAFCRTPLPWPLAFAKRVLRFLKRKLRIGAGKNTAPAMFQGS